jgi:hypothetical protein
MALDTKKISKKETGKDMRIIQKTLRKSKRNLTSSDRWILLGSILSSMGAEFKNKQLSLDWGDEDEKQYKLLAQMFNSLLNVSTVGAFNEGTWNIQG